MSSIKVKQKKKLIIDNRVTLHAKYNEKNEYFDYKQNELILNQAKIKKINSKIRKMKNNNELSYEELEEKLKLIDIRNELSKENEKIENNTENIDYLLDTGHLLFDYFKGTKNNKNKTINNYKQNNTNSKSVMEYFNKDQTQIKSEKSKANIYEEYESKIYGTPILNINNQIDICDTCLIEKILYLSDGKLICPSCGEETFVLIDSDKPSYKEPPREVSYFAYKRINHFNEWLAQFQAKESTDIPKELYENILLELKKERIMNMEDLSPQKIREILKKLKKNKYYEHVPHIINRLNGIPPPIMSREMEEKLRRMFKEIQVPFHKHCPKTRKNFLSYSYVLHKLVQLLELDDFLPCFMLLKSREKLHQQDQIWKNICYELKWEFIASV